LERKVPEKDRRWEVAEETLTYDFGDESNPNGWPIYTNTEI
jgi:hypothetical protein